MAESDEEDDPLVEAVSSVLTGLILVVAFGLMFLGVESFWMVFVVGFGGILPMSIGLVRYYQQRSDSKESQTARETGDALEELQNRYARGEISDEEFDRRVERLLETESVRGAQKYAERIEIEEPAGQRDREPERE